jgi:hypothetical protein
MFWLWPQAKKPWLFGFGTKAKAKPKIWPGMAFGLAWQYLRSKPGQKAKASIAHFEGHWQQPEKEYLPLSVWRSSTK